MDILNVCMFIPLALSMYYFEVCIGTKKQFRKDPVYIVPSSPWDSPGLLYLSDVCGSGCRHGIRCDGLCSQ